MISWSSHIRLILILYEDITDTFTIVEYDVIHFCFYCCEVIITGLGFNTYLSRSVLCFVAFRDFPRGEDFSIEEFLSFDCTYMGDLSHLIVLKTS